MKKYNILSLFDGISCGQVALERANIKKENYIASEIDKYAIEIAKKNYPNTLHIGNIENISYNEKTKKLYNNKTQEILYKGDIDIIIGGSPCQSFSFAGKQNGMSTKENIEVTNLEQYLELKNKNFEFIGQSYLFWEYVRLLKEIKPKYFLLENVKMKKYWENIITKTLEVNPIRINSENYSAQRRDRLYWTNIDINKEEILKERNELLLKDIIREEDNENYHLSKTHYAAFLKSYKWKANLLNEKSKPLLATYYKQPPHCPYIPCEKSESGYRMLSPIECERLQTLPNNYTQGISKTQRYKCIGNGWTVDVIAKILSYL